jgi:RNA polymerase sigma-70 factor (ECF subfamily)
MRDIPSGNIDAFTQRLGAMRPKLHRYCARMTGSVIDGEDVVQETMIKALEAFPGETAIDNVEAWVFRIAHNRALDLLRRRSRQEAWISDEPVDEIPDPSVDAEHRIATAANLRTFMQLLPAQRAAVILMDVLGYSLQEIGAVLEVSIASVKASLHRGRMRLRELAAQGPAAALPALDAADLQQLSAYVERFNAHDFDGIRTLLADDVRLDLVNRLHANGRGPVGRYFGNYSSIDDWRFGLGRVEGRPAILVFDPQDAPVYFILVDWSGTEISRILDFRYARYVMETAEITTSP